MIFVLLIFLLLLTFISFIVFYKDPIHPVTLINEIFLFCVLIAIMNIKKWEFDFSLLSVVVILTSLFSIFLGSFLVQMIFANKNKSSRLHPNRRYYVSSLKLFLIICYMLFCGLLLFKQTLSIARSVNSSATYLNMFYYARNAYMFNDASLGVLLSLISLSISGLGYAFSYAIISNFIWYGRNSIKIKWFIPVLLFIVIGYTSTNRTYLIMFITFVFLLFIIEIYKKSTYYNKQFYNLKKILMYGFATILLFFLVFQFMGLFSMKTGTLTTFDMLSGYTGSAIPAFDLFLKQYTAPSSNFGEECFYGLYGLLSHFGVNFNSVLHKEFVYFANGYSTNIYSAIRSYIHDFGYVGNFIICFFIGAIFTFLYNMMKFGNNNKLLILYCILSYGIVMFPIEDMILHPLFSVTQIFTVIFTYIFVDVIFVKKNKIVSININDNNVLNLS